MARIPAPPLPGGLLLALWLGAAVPAHADRHVHWPRSDAEDGELVNGTTWAAKPTDPNFASLLLTLGHSAGSTYATHFTFSAPELAPGQSVSEVRLRMNMQGGAIGAPLEVTITAALDFDDLVPPGPARFALPRTTASVAWTIDAPWDSSGQLIAKWRETPDLSAIVEEVLAQPGWATGPKVLAFFLEPAGGASPDRFVRFDDTHPRWPTGGNAGMEPVRLRVNETYHDAFWGQEMLCRPTTTSMEVNVIPHLPTFLHVEWGTSPGSLPNQTTVLLADSATPAQIRMEGLAPDTRYHYRLRYRPSTEATWATGPVRTFLTLPEPGSDARVCVTADIHVTNQRAAGQYAMMAQLDTTLAYMPGFDPEGWHAWLDLGDLVVIRATRVAMDQEETEQRYREAREYVDKAAHSLPFLFVRGNHEEVNGWDYDGTPDNTAVWSGRMLLKWFAPPLPDAFYSGNAAPFPEIGVPGNYWACDIGDLRVRALDPFLFSPRRPHNGHGEVNGSLDGWDWQLGNAQYDWLWGDLTARRAPYSLLAIHHLTSTYTGSGQYYGRGGIEVVDWAIAGRPTFEWGGQDSTGANVLAAKRPAWTHGSVHSMLAETGNQVVIKGHEHFHARQELDGIVYLTVAKPDDNGDQTGNLWGWRFFSFYPDSLTHFEPNSGFVAIRTTPAQATYEYVQTFPVSGIGTVLDGFTLFPAVTSAPLSPPGPAGLRTWIRGASPNPASGAVRVDFELGRPGATEVAVFDAAGRRVRELYRGVLPVGAHATTWDGRDAAGRRVSAGVYFAKLSSDGRVDSVKMIVLR